MIVVFTDLDGTLLDHHTYSYEEAREGMEILRGHGAELVLVSSKTFDEMSLLHRELNLKSPLIFENGGGIGYYRDGRWDMEISGEGVESIKKKLDVIEHEISHRVLALIDLSDEQVSSLTGLSVERAALSKKRRATLPFMLDGNAKLDGSELERLNIILQAHNLLLTRGGRFYHLIPGDTDKGKAVEKIVKWYSYSVNSVETLAFGDSENDIPMLAAVNTAYLVRRHDGTVIKYGSPHIHVTDNIGPAGFTEGIKKYFKIE